MIEKYCLDNEKVGKVLYYFIYLQNGDMFVTAYDSGTDRQCPLSYSGLLLRFQSGDAVLTDILWSGQSS
jgi:hypothetical protein